MRTRCLAEAGSRSPSSPANSSSFRPRLPVPLAPAISNSRLCTSTMDGGSLTVFGASLRAVRPTSPTWRLSLLTSSLGMPYAIAMAETSSRSPRPISTGAKKGASRPWIRYVTGSISSTEQAPYSSDRMRTSSFRLLVASNWSRYAASPLNLMADQLRGPRPRGLRGRPRLEVAAAVADGPRLVKWRYDGGSNGIDCRRRRRPVSRAGQRHAGPDLARRGGGSPGDGGRLGAAVRGAVRLPAHLRRPARNGWYPGTGHPQQQRRRTRPADRTGGQRDRRRRVPGGRSLVRRLPGSSDSEPVLAQGRRA